MSQTSANRSEAFGRLLSGAINSIATYEGRTAPAVEDELGQLLHLSGKTIQRYKAGNLPPEARAIEVLAEAAVRRGYLGREWLGRFLHAAHYPAADTLLNQLCPAAQTRPRPPRVYHNLPAPTYSQFVMREQAFTEVLDGLDQRSAAVLIVGLGGNGKTSLAREVAARCLQENAGAARFDAAVWVSDKDRPGTTNLSVVLDEIARTLDYPGFTQFAHDEKRYEVEQLLRRQRVLLVVDNFETITDGALLTWLLRLPEPSKALITSREYGRAFRNSTIVLDLRGMREEEAKTLVNQRLRMLRMEQLVSEQAQLEPLLAVTGGNPKAIEIALGLVKHERRPLQQVVDDLHSARGELFDDLFARAWALLDEAARRVLMVMTFFPTSASGDALAATADVHGYTFDRAVERLVDLALLDVQQEGLNNIPRYALHLLVRAFAGAQIAETVEYAKRARERWVKWYIKLVSHVGYCWNNLELLKMLDLEQKTMHSVIIWLNSEFRYSDITDFGIGASYYYHVRGLYSIKPAINLIYAQSARYIGNENEEARALSYYIQTLGKLTEINEATKYLPRLKELQKSNSFMGELDFEVKHAIAYFHVGNRNFSEAQKIWREILNASELYPDNAIIVSRNNLAMCLFKGGNLKEARKHFQIVIQDSERIHHTRAAMLANLWIASIDLIEKKVDSASTRLEQLRLQVSQIQDKWLLAFTQRSFVKLYISRNDLSAARTAIAEAIDLLERLGMRRELAEAREELTQLGDLDGAPA